MSYQHIFAGNPLDRGEAQRRDEQWISDRAADPSSRFLPMHNLNVLISDDTEPRLGWVSLDDLARLGGDSPYAPTSQASMNRHDPILLGVLDGKAHFVVDVSADGDAESRLQQNENFRFEDCRTAGTLLPGDEAGIMAQARAQLDWHKRHRFCSVCGHESEKGRGGQVRKCPQCNAQHFPRTDPVVIMLVVDVENDRCLLGQSRGRLARMRTYSALAGFMDQGETIEEAVAREVMEEAGIKVKNVRYHSSQPWPFPSSLMIGCLAEAATNEIAMDNEEMTDVQWFERDEVLKALEGKSERLTIPQPIAIAHHLIKAWATKSF